jgi:hypothetical protein
MDYITNRLEKKIGILKAFNERRELALYYQVRLEYILIFILSYLWNKNFDKLSITDKEFVLSKIARPTLGDIITICRKLDRKREVFGVNKINEAIEKYPFIRNKHLGHGYTFEDKIQEYLQNLEELYQNITSNNPDKPSFLSQEFDFILVLKYEDKKFSGMRFSCSEMTYSPWICAEDVNDFQIGNIYANCDIYNYFRVSPFINIDKAEKIYLYCSIQEKLLGQAKYNQIFETNQTFMEWKDFSNFSLNIDSFKRKSSNGTILNNFENNYKKYIPLKIKEKLKRFLLENRASVCATVWGHGGVGKTATIQSLCEDLSNEAQFSEKQFDYIIFLTAKDRKFNFETGEIEDTSADDRVDSLDSIIQKINQILFDEPVVDKAKVKNYQGRLLLIIDDFETFPSDEKVEVQNFINELDINHHKVVITTRANIRIGEQITTSELSADETMDFLKELLPSEFSNKIEISKFERDFSSQERKDKIFEITSGRPVFIFQFAHLYAANQGNPDKILESHLKSKSSAVRFLYERIYDYLQLDARKLFVVIGKLIDSEDELSHLLGKAKYVLNMEHEEERFNNATDELIKLKIIEVKEGDVFHVYSKEIWEIMKFYYNEFDERIQANWNERLIKVGRTRNPVDQSLLLNADKSRLTQDEEVVKRAYNRVLNRHNCPKDIRLQALLNLGAFLFNDKGKKQEAIELLNGYSSFFENDWAFLKNYATYLWSTTNLEPNGSLKYRQDAVKLLLEYYGQGLDLDDITNLELTSMILIFRSTLIISYLEDLKIKLEYKEIKSSHYNMQYQEQINKLKDVSLLGEKIFEQTKKVNLDDIKLQSAKSRIVNALLQFLDIADRLEQFTIAEEICLFAFENFTDVHAQFYQKFKKLYASQNKSVHEAYNIYLRKIMGNSKNDPLLMLSNKEMPKVGDIKVIKLGTIRK